LLSDSSSRSAGDGGGGGALRDRAALLVSPRDADREVRRAIPS